MTATTATRPAPTAGELTHRQVLTILTGLLMGMFLAALDQTIVSTAIRTIADDLNGLSSQAWVTTAYLITSTIATPLYGKLSDIYGRKGFFLFAIAVFITGSAACSFATSMPMLAAFRAFQGIGAGGLMSLALAIIGDIVPPRERAKYQGYFMAVFGSSSVLGPVIGGFFADQSRIFGIAGWRWVFLINVPIGIVALFVVARTLHLQHTRQNQKIDWWGAAALILCLVPLLTVAEQGQGWGWGSTKSVGCFIVGGVGLALFILAEALMKDSALIPLRLFKIRAVSVTLIASIVIGIAMFGVMMMMPLYMQIVHGATPMMSGFMMLPMVAGMMIASLAAGIIISKTGVVRPFPLIGIVMVGITALFLSQITADTALWIVMTEMFAAGFAVGLCNQPMTLIVQSAVDRREIGVATSAATFFRQMGGTIGVAVFLSMLFSTVGDHIKNNLLDAAKAPSFLQALMGAAKNPAFSQQNDPEAFGIINGLTHPGQASGALGDITNDSSVLQRIPAEIAHPFLQGFAQSMDQVFLCAAAISVLGLVVLLFMPRIVLRTASPMAEAARDMTKHLEHPEGHLLATDERSEDELAQADSAQARHAIEDDSTTNEDLDAEFERLEREESTSAAKTHGARRAAD